MRTLRWWQRHLAVLLLVVSPAIGGQLLPLGHPCPVQAPWTGSAEITDPHAGHAHAGHVTPDAPAPTDPHTHDDCSCIGTCAAPVALSAPAPVVVATATLVGPATAQTWSARERADARARPHDRLPPQTAPPLA